MYHHPKAKWKVTKSWIEDGPEKPAKVEVEGPSTCPDSDASFTWTRFKMYDDDGELYYEGVMNQYCDGFEPLNHYGMPNAGCTEIRILEQGKWVTI